MTSANNQQHLLTLKVLRLSKPSFNIKSEITSTITCRDGQEFISDIGVSDILELPTAFGNIYLGEKFTSYLSINNDSLITVNDVAFKAELQTTSQRFTLVDTIGTTPTTSMESVQSHQKQASMNQVSLLPKQSVEFLFDHEIKELGIHILVCSAHYTPISAPLTSGSSTELLNPLSVKTKVNTLSDGKVCLEIQIQNLATVPLCLDKLGFTANDIFSSQDLNDHDNFSSSKIISPQDTRQYLFVLTPTDENDLACRTTPNLGRLDINWKSTLGQSGHLQTSQLTRKVPSVSPFEVVVLEKPQEATVEKSFTIKLRIKNNLSGERQRLAIKGDKSKMTHILLNGSNEVDFGVLEGLSYFDFTMDFFPIAPGIHPISGLLVSEKISGMNIELNNLAFIRVIAPGA